MYFHLADYGRKMDLIADDPNVSVEVDNFCGDKSPFCTISLMGRPKKVTSKAEREKTAQALLDTANERGGMKNVAARHGVTSLNMDTLTSRNSVVYKLEADAFVALKSP